MSDLVTYRRFCLIKRIVTARQGEYANSGIWQYKQEAEPGTALPTGFPYLSQLSACGYTTEEDVRGADDEELRDFVGLNKNAADQVLAALAAL